MRIHKKNSINASFIFYFASIAILMIVFGVVLYTRLLGIGNLKAVSAQLGKLSENVSDMKYNEYSLMLKDQGNEYFINTGKSVYVEQYRLKFQESQQLITNFFEMSPLNDHVLLEKLSNIKNSLDQSNAIFNELIKNIREIGYLNFGLIGELRGNIHEHEKIISKLPDSTLLREKVLLIRRYEKDFLAWKKVRFKEKLIALIEDYKNLLISRSNIDQATKLTLVSNIEKYQSAFIKITERSKVVGYSMDEGLFKEEEEISKQVKDDLVILTDFFDGRYSSMYKHTVYFIFIYFVSSIVLILLLSVRQTRKMIEPLIRIKKYVAELCSGNFPERLALSTNSEVQEIIDTLNNFVIELERKAQYAEKIGHGEYDAEYQGMKTDDKLAIALTEMAHKLKTNHELEADRKNKEENELWASKGMSLFNDILRNSHDSIEKIAYLILSNLIEYLKVNQGGAFIVRNKEKSPYLELVASYAFNKERKYQKIIQFKEGLTGTCAMEKSTIYLEQVPPEYIKLTSGLGESRPESLLLVPIMNSGDLYGILELASFNPIEPHQIKFVEKLAENIAITFLTVEITERTNSLLAHTLEQAKELEKKDEETSRNLIRMQKSQEDSAMRDAQMMGLLSGLNLSTFISEYDTDTNIININDKYLRLLNMSRSKVIGQSHRKFTNMDSAIEYPNGYTEFWSQLRKGNIQTKITKIPNFIQKEDVWLSEVYTPVLGPDGTTSKILCIGIDITSNKKQEHILSLQSQQIARKENELLEHMQKMKNTATELENESLMLQILIKNSKDGIFIKDASGRYTIVNENFLKGIDVGNIDDVLGKTVFDILDPKYANLHADTDKMIVETGKPIFNLMQHDKTERGEEYWLQINKIPIINKNKETIGIIGISRDVTHDKKAELQFKETIDNLTSLQKKYKTLNEIHQDMSVELANCQSDWDGLMLSFDRNFSFCIIQLDGTIIQANEQYARQQNAKVEDLIGNNILQNLKGEAAKKFLPIWQKIIKGDSYTTEIKDFNKDGKGSWSYIHYQPVRDERQNVSKIFFIGFEVSLEKQNES